MKELVFAGFGGQGVLTCGLILSDIAMAGGLNVTWSPSYGAAMRGGTANCTVKYGEGYIYNPQQEEPDLVMAMNDASFEMFAPMIAPGGICVVSDLVTCDTGIRDDITVVRVPCVAIADSLGDPKAANVVMTGAVVKLLGDFTKEDALAALRSMFAKKGKAASAEANDKAFCAGHEAV